MNESPISLFVNNRLWHTRQTVEALLKNELASESDLIVFSDGPKTDDQKSEVKGRRSNNGLPTSDYRIQEIITAVRGTTINY